MEICKQADRSGEKVGRLMLVDPMPKIFKKAHKVRVWRWKKKLRAALPPRIRSMLKMIPLVSRRTSVVEADAYEQSLDARRRRQASLETRIRMRTGAQDAALVSSDTSYSADAMRAVSRSLGKAFRGYVPSPWNGPAFVLTSNPRKEGIGLLQSRLPNARFRVVPYHHGSLFVEGLPEILKFFGDALNPDVEGAFL
jgi:thioesterase domain-containing protein